MVENKTQATEEVANKQKKKKANPITVKANRKGRHIIGFLNFLRVLVLPWHYLLRPYRYFGNRNDAIFSFDAQK